MLAKFLKTIGSIGRKNVEHFRIPLYLSNISSDNATRSYHEWHGFMMEAFTIIADFLPENLQTLYFSFEVDSDFMTGMKREYRACLNPWHTPDERALTEISDGYRRRVREFVLSSIVHIFYKKFWKNWDNIVKVTGRYSVDFVQEDTNGRMHMAHTDYGPRCRRMLTSLLKSDIKTLKEVEESQRHLKTLAKLRNRLLKEPEPNKSLPKTVKPRRGVHKKPTTVGTTKKVKSSVKARL